MAQNVALTEPVQPVLGERRVVGNRVIEIEPAKPPVCEVEFYFLAQLPLGANAVASPNPPDPVRSGIIVQRFTQMLFRQHSGR
jgi:hypothetical protein